MNNIDSFLYQGSLKEIKNKQDFLFYMKSGEKNKEIVKKIILSYDLNNSLLSSLKPYFFTPDLQFAIDSYFLKREVYITRLLENI